MELWLLIVRSAYYVKFRVWRIVVVLVNEPLKQVCCLIVHHHVSIVESESCNALSV